jgi:hypothetical protein
MARAKTVHQQQYTAQILAMLINANPFRGSNAPWIELDVFMPPKESDLDG